MVNNKLFGTDGIRGHVDSFLLAPENFLTIGQIIGQLVKEQNPHKKVIIGRDTRASGEYLEHALAAGISSVGINCELLGVIPTGAVAYLTKQSSAALGLVISASHNPFYDNGLKIFDHNGYKISDEMQLKIEASYFNKENHSIKISKLPGSISKKIDAAKLYLSFAKLGDIARQKLLNKKIVIDCANGAASKIIPQIFTDLSPNVHIISDQPNGSNINMQVGSEFPDKLKEEVLRTNADIGIAFDGDADRVIFVDEKGNLIDGDAILAVLAISLKHRGLLKHNTLVTTIMSSKALDQCLKPFDINVERTAVGDKNVVKLMREKDFIFGGEHSGHLIFLDKITTGDGIIAALAMISVWLESIKTLSELCSVYKPTPRLLRDIVVKKKPPLTEMQNTNQAIMNANTLLKDIGRVMLRYSGTEMKARLLVEAHSDIDCQRIADEISREFDIEMRQKT